VIFNQDFQFIRFLLCRTFLSKGGRYELEEYAC
jgi:hypothetical protein